jgi:hypothetical protein
MPDWDVNAERQLLFAIIAFKAASVAKKEWDDVAELMNLGFTGNACRYGDVTLYVFFLVSFLPYMINFPTLQLYLLALNLNSRYFFNSY